MRTSTSGKSRDSEQGRRTILGLRSVKRLRCARAVISGCYGPDVFSRLFRVVNTDEHLAEKREACLGQLGAATVSIK